MERTGRWGRGLVWWGLAPLGVALLLVACSRPPEADERAALPSMAVGQGRLGAGTEVSPPFGVDPPRLRPRATATGPSAVAWDGQQFLVVWQDRRTGSEGLFAARVRPDGTVLDPAGIRLLLGGRDEENHPSVAFDGTRFVVVWLGNSGLFGAHVSTEGTVLRRFDLVRGDEVRGRPPALACAPELCLVGYSSFGDDGSLLVVSRVSSDGTLLEPRPIVLSPLGGELDVDQPSAAWDGQQFLVAWEDSRGGPGTPDLYAARVLPDGTVKDPGGFPLSTAPGAQRRPAVVWTGRRFLVVWEDSRGADSDVYAARVRPSGTVDEPEGFPLSTAPGAQLAPRVAHIGGRSLVVWEDARGGGLEVRGARVKEDATVEDSGFLVSSGDFARVGLPAVAAGSDRYFVSFAVRPLFPGRVGELLGTRVERDGDVRDRPPLRLTRSADEQHSPVVAASDDGYLAVWRDFRESAGPALYAARVRPDGTVRDNQGIRLPAGAEASDAAVASDGRDFLVVWSEPRAGGFTLRGARVSRSGLLLDAAGLTLATASSAPFAAPSAPRVASSGEGFLVVWADSRDSGSIRGVRVTRGGEVLEPDGLRVSSDAFAVEPRVTHDGSQYLVVYGTARFVPGSVLHGLRAVRVSEEGRVLDVPSLQLSPELFNLPQRGVAVASDGRDSLVVWADAGRLPDDRGDVRMLRVTREGTVLEPEDSFVASGAARQEYPSVTFDGRDYRVAWEEWTPADAEFIQPDIQGARVSREGRVLERFPVSTHPSEERTPSLASVGDGSALVFYWEFLVAPDAMAYRVQGRVLRGP